MCLSKRNIIILDCESQSLAPSLGGYEPAELMGVGMRMKLKVLSCLTIAAMTTATAGAQSASDRPWEIPATPLVIDPYEANSIDWDKLSQDRAVKGIIHRAYFGTTRDARFEARTAEAKRRGYSVGLYLLGRPGDPVVQADLLVAAGERTGVKLLALDIENMDPRLSMTLADAQRFIERVHELTGRYPLFYTNFSTYTHISRNFDSSSSFARTPLWIARFRGTHGLNDARVWKDYSVWQFQSEINCKRVGTCFRRVAGTNFDMDVNVFRGTEAELRTFFGDKR